MRKIVKQGSMNCDGHWPPSAGVRILCIVCLMLIGGFGSAAAAASYLGPVAVVASKDGKSLSVFIGRSGVRDDDLDGTELWHTTLGSLYLLHRQATRRL
jgi:hypothetical protein